MGGSKGEMKTKNRVDGRHKIKAAKVVIV